MRERGGDAAPLRSVLAALVFLALLATPLVVRHFSSACDLFTAEIAEVNVESHFHLRVLSDLR